jgi:atlastin
MTAEGGLLSEGNLNDSIKENDKDSFAWRGGEERQTTGIWMWSEPFIRTTPSSDGPMAILLMDTQGMFDNETSMALTAQIFGLSTFISSFQVQKRLRELASYNWLILPVYYLDLQR